MSFNPHKKTDFYKCKKKKKAQKLRNFPTFTNNEAGREILKTNPSYILSTNYLIKRHDHM